MPNPAKPVTVVFAFDRAWRYTAAAAIASLLRHYDDSRPLQVFALTDEKMPEETAQKFESLGRIREFCFREIVASAGIFSGIRTSQHISDATYYRLHLHKILPQDVDRAVYLDADLVVLDCISKLYDADLQGRLFGGIEDARSSKYGKDFRRSSARHVNGGVLVVDVDQMREQSYMERILQYIADEKENITLGDQQIINEALEGSIGHLPLRWNVHGPLLETGWALKNSGKANSFSFLETCIALADPAIVHYAGRRKPWDYPRAGFSAPWFRYLNDTDYSDLYERSGGPLPWSWLTRPLLRWSHGTVSVRLP
jgi:capsular polysaccharide export protein